MAKDLEAEIKDGQAVKDLLKTAGWGLIKAKIQEEIEDERIALKEVDKQEAFTMLVDFIDHQKTMKGLERIFDIIQEFLVAKEDAENKLRKD